ncbi:MAG: class I SAM-dependent methyltransferase [Microbacteriaceae bacterium]
MSWVYDRGAGLYDVLSGETLIYRRGREAGVHLLGLRSGDAVLDVGCGTGLNFPLLIDAVGATGRVIGLDRSAAMLEVADRRVTTHGWSNVTTVHADATDFTVIDVGVVRVDAVIATYSLSVIDDWSAAWDRMRDILRSGGRAGIVDMQRPTGAATILSPLAQLACWVGRSDIDAHPWSVLQASGGDYRQVTVRGGHIVAAAATIP